MRDQFIAYLLDLLDADERQWLEEQLARDPSMQVELTVFRRAVELFECDPEHVEPPQALAARTCQRLHARLQSGCQQPPDGPIAS
jgi:anti-sigma factor RsiW